mmetsp:Transcript_14967/g.36606  ORF Transcript_14967/g.36606 Transcript_14967/m.36606 type:complete len:343 (+) Transcript_14967:301-1329(+)
MSTAWLFLVLLGPHALMRGMAVSPWYRCRDALEIGGHHAEFARVPQVVIFNWDGLPRGHVLGVPDLGWLLRRPLIILLAVAGSSCRQQGPTHVHARLAVAVAVILHVDLHVLWPCGPLPPLALQSVHAHLVLQLRLGLVLRPDLAPLSPKPLHVLVLARAGARRRRLFPILIVGRLIVPRNRHDTHRLQRVLLIQVRPRVDDREGGHLRLPFPMILEVQAADDEPREEERPNEAKNIDLEVVELEVDADREVEEEEVLEDPPLLRAQPVRHPQRNLKGQLDVLPGEERRRRRRHTPDRRIALPHRHRAVRAPNAHGGRVVIHPKVVPIQQHRPATHSRAVPR